MKWKNYASIYDENDPGFQAMRMAMSIWFSAKKVMGRDKEDQCMDTWIEYTPRSWVGRWIRRIYYRIRYRKIYNGTKKKNITNLV